MKLALLLFLIGSADSCLRVQSIQDLIPIPNSLCPPIKLLDQKGVQTNLYGSYLKNMQVWKPTIGFSTEYEWLFNVMCSEVPGASSFYTVMFRKDQNPIYINRVVNNVNTFNQQPSWMNILRCDQVTDGSYQWIYYDRPQEDLSFACIADVDSCKCPPINGEMGVRLEERYPSAECSMYYGSCSQQVDPLMPLIYATVESRKQVIHSADFITQLGLTFYEDLLCVKTSESTFQWHYSNLALDDVTIGCNTIENEFGSDIYCACGAYLPISSYDQVAARDKKKQYVGAVVQTQSYKPGCQFDFICENGKAVVFSDNYDPIEKPSQLFFKCVNNPLSEYSQMWLVDGVRLINPAGACLKIPGVSSFYTVMFRSNGSPLYINRVVNNQSTFVEQPRSIGDMKCDLDTDGTYKWFFHDYPITDMSFACQADVESCNCPSVVGIPNHAVLLETRYPEAPDQCSLYDAYCEYEGQLPFLYSNNITINTGAVAKTFYEDLTCIKETSGYSWYFFNQKLENFKVGCDTIENAFGSEEVCYCGAFPLITSAREIWSLDPQYFTASIGTYSFQPSCQFYMTCEEGFFAVVFSSNYKSLRVVDGIPIKCTYNPLSNYLRMWVVNGVRVLNPVGACVKTH